MCFNAHRHAGITKSGRASQQQAQEMQGKFQQIQNDLPTGMSALVAFDSTKYINSAIKEVVTTLTETVLIVVIVIFLFLGSFRSVFVPVVAIIQVLPISIGGFLAATRSRLKSSIIWIISSAARTALSP